MLRSAEDGDWTKVQLQLRPSGFLITHSVEISMACVLMPAWLPGKRGSLPESDRRRRL